MISLRNELDQLQTGPTNLNLRNDLKIADPDLFVAQAQLLSLGNGLLVDTVLTGFAVLLQVRRPPVRHRLLCRWKFSPLQVQFLSIPVHNF